jgi:hypothetical protein
MGRRLSAFEEGSVGTPLIDVRGLGVRVVLAPTPQLWEVPTMSESMALVGLDVHQALTVAAVLDPSTGELRVERLRGEPASVGNGTLTWPHSGGGRASQRRNR